MFCFLWRMKSVFLVTAQALKSVCLANITRKSSARFSKKSNSASNIWFPMYTYRISFRWWIGKLWTVHWGATARSLNPKSVEHEQQLLGSWVRACFNAPDEIESQIPLGAQYYIENTVLTKERYVSGGAGRMDLQKSCFIDGLKCQCRGRPPVCVVGLPRATMRQLTLEVERGLCWLSRKWSSNHESCAERKSSYKNKGKRNNSSR